VPSSNGLRFYAKLAYFAYFMRLNEVNNVTKENSKVILGRDKINLLFVDCLVLSESSVSRHGRQLSSFPCYNKGNLIIR
jgi:hypothetical protein